MICKGKACALNDTDEYNQGYSAGKLNQAFDNPYDFFDEYEKCYSWAIGHQVGYKKRDREFTIDDSGYFNFKKGTK